MHAVCVQPLCSLTMHVSAVHFALPFKNNPPYIAYSTLTQYGKREDCGREERANVYAALVTWQQRALKNDQIHHVSRLFFVVFAATN